MLWPDVFTRCMLHEFYSSSILIPILKASMIGSKVVLTYKRKRLSSTPVLGFQEECPNRTHGCQTLEVLKAPVNEEHESERRNPEENDRKKLFSSCVKQQDGLPKLEKVSDSCEDAMKVNKPGFPLITFSRRSRQKKSQHLDATDVQEKSTFVEKYDLVAVKRSISTTDNGCLLNLSTDLTGSDFNPKFCSASHEKMTIEDLDLCDVGSLSVPKTEIEKSTNEELANGSFNFEDTPLIAESSADESRIITSDDVVNAVITIDKKQDEGSLDISGLSKPPSEISGSVDCKLTLESSFDRQACNNVSENHRESTDSSRSRVLELLDQRIGVTSLSQVHCVPPRHPSSSHMRGPDLPSVSIGQSQASKTNFLQLFPEDRVNDILPPQSPSVMHPQDRSSNPTSNQKPVHLRGSTCYLPSFDVEARNGANFENRSLESGVQYPSDSVSLVRHKMMLDNILNKARAVKSKLSDSFDRPSVWSEEELDFLWIGVRRHGTGSWDAILKDPRLHFSSWRSPRELAEQWEIEQSNLLRTKPIEEPQLSLGLRGRSIFDPYVVNGPKGNLTLPHWLRGSFPPTRPFGVPSVSFTGHSGLMEWINQPFCGSNRTMGMTDRIGPGPEVTSGATHWAQPLAQPIATHPISKPDEVIVIDSDASSEDTISDDHHRRRTISDDHSVRN